jgi:hypothetical protein
MSKSNKEMDVIEWLEINGLSKKCINIFIQNQYKGTPVSALKKKAVNKILKDKPGWAAKVNDALEEWNAQPAESETPEIPELPAGAEFDLSTRKPKIKNINFEMPNHLSVRATKAAVVSPIELEPNDWIVVARNSSLLKGFDMDGEEPTRAKSSVLWWKVTKKRDFVDPKHLSAESSSSLVYSEKTQKYVNHTFDTEAASAGYAFAAGSFERNHEERSAGASTTRELFMRAMWNFPRAMLYLEKCTVVSPDFTRSVKKALKKADPPSALGEVFKEYGHAVAMEVLLGGQLWFDQVEKSSADRNETQIKEVYKAAAQVKYEGAEGDVGVLVGKGATFQQEVQRTVKLSTFKCWGGDATLVSDPEDWASTVKAPKLWDTIARRNVIPTYKLLDDLELQKKVLEVWTKIPPFFGTALDLACKDNGGGSERISTSGFVVGVRQVPPAKDGDRGSVLVVSGPGDDPKEGDSKTAAGAAFVHRYQAGDVRYDCNGVCIPVRAAYHYQYEATVGTPERRLAFIPSKVSWGDWEPVDISDGFSALGDGFLLASIDTQGRDGSGELYAIVDGRRVAGCSAHRNHASDEWIDRASFCIPMPTGSKVSFETAFGGQSPAFEVNWAPLVSKNAKMQKMEIRSLNTQFTASTDGVLFGCISTEQPARGTLRLYCYPKSRTEPDNTNPLAASSIHYTQVGQPRLVKASSAMLPVRRGTHYEARYDKGTGSPTADLFWIPVV